MADKDIKKYVSKDGKTTFIKDKVTGKRLVQNSSGSFIANDKKFEK